MRGDDDIVHHQQRVVRQRRFGIGHVKRRAGQMSLLQDPDQRLLIDDRPARGVHQVAPLGNEAQLALADHVAGGGHERHMQGDEFGVGKHGVEIVGQRHAVRGLLPKVHQGIADTDIHAQPERADRRDPPADAPVADDAQITPPEFRAPHPLAVQGPAFPQEAVPGHNAGRKRRQQRDRVLRRGLRGGVGVVDDDDAALARRLHVDLVHADAGRGDHLQAVSGARHEFGVDRSPSRHHDIRPGDPLQFRIDDHLRHLPDPVRRPHRELVLHHHFDRHPASPRISVAAAVIHVGPPGVASATAGHCAGFPARNRRGPEWKAGLAGFTDHEEMQIFLLFVP